MPRHAGYTFPPARLEFRRVLAARLREAQVAILGPRAGVRMARSLGVDRRVWQAALNGEHDLTGAYVLRLIAVHHVSPAWLLRGTGPMLEPVRPPVELPPDPRVLAYVELAAELLWRAG